MRLRCGHNMTWLNLEASSGKDGELVYLFNWLGEKFQYTRSGGVGPGNHVYTAEFMITGQDEVTKSASGTPYIDYEMQVRAWMALD